MKSFRFVTNQIRQYVSDEEIVAFLKSNAIFYEIYLEIKDQQLTSVIPLVSLENRIKHTFNLQIIVKHEKKLLYGFYEYFIVKNFVNKKINLYILFEVICISTGADLLDLIKTVHNQLTELGITINQEYILHTRTEKKRIYFEKVFRDVALN